MGPPCTSLPGLDHLRRLRLQVHLAVRRREITPSQERRLLACYDESSHPIAYGLLPARADGVPTAWTDELPAL